MRFGQPVAFLKFGESMNIIVILLILLLLGGGGYGFYSGTAVRLVKELWVNSTLYSESGHNGFFWLWDG